MSGTEANGTTASKRSIRLFVSDVDGTLVTDDKQVTKRTKEAVSRLEAAGIGFTVVSARPPFGLQNVIAALDLRLPVGAFNGATIVDRDLAVIEQSVLPGDLARETVDLLQGAGIAVWLFTKDAWLIQDLDADNIALERHTLQTDPVIVEDFGAALDGACKIVGSSNRIVDLAALAETVKARFDGRATIHLSQPYYLDVTPHGADKGRFVETLSRRLGIDPSAIAVIGDMDNDVSMLLAGGLSFAMGNASAKAKAAAQYLTDSNEADGVATAIDRLLAIAEVPAPPIDWD